MKKRKCKYCETFFMPNPKVGKRHKICGSPSCKKALKAENNAAWRRKNPDYYKGYYFRLKEWLCSHPTYLKRYREEHPEYVEKNRIAQRIRDRKRRLNLDIQAQIRRQLPEITEILWGFYHLDRQVQMPLKPLESTLLFSTLPCLDIQAQIDKSCRIRENSSIQRKGVMKHVLQKAH
ncbi:MAG: hypothetical protein OEW69_09235 [Nitrospirota bacterium]|nr:hypothetical protein [Nitrospirota bacterium]